MFSMITNIYNKKTKGPTLMELFTATGKLKKFFWQLEMFDVCTTGDTAHVDTIFKLLSTFYIWLIVHHVMILGKWPTWCTNLCITLVIYQERVNMLTRVWQQLEYRIDVCRVTRGAHIEHLFFQISLFHRAFCITKFYLYQLMHFF